MALVCMLRTWDAELTSSHGRDDEQYAVVA